MQSEIIRGVCFSIFSNFGPEAIFMYPPPVEEEDFIPSPQRIVERNYLQIAIKSISLLIGDNLFDISIEEAKKMNYFGILPYPDLKVNSLTYFRFLILTEMTHPIACTLSLLVKENAKTFIYDYYEQLEKNMQDFTEALMVVLAEKLKSDDHKISESEIKDHLQLFLSNIEALQSVPFNPILADRRLNILFTGFRYTGKSAFISILKNNYANIIRDPAVRVTDTFNKFEKVDFLWTSIVKYGLENEEIEKIVRDESVESELYLSKADLIYYFIDITDPQISNNRKVIEKILKINNIATNHVPIVIIITKVDTDLQNTPEFRMKINMIKNTLAPVLKEYPHKYFYTSIFSKHSVLSAFSFGLMKLTPNQSAIAVSLQKFSRKNNILNCYLVNQSGLVISAYEESLVCHEFAKLTQTQIFEIISPQIVSLFSFISAGKNPNVSPSVKILLNEYYCILVYFKGTYGLIAYLKNEDLKVNENINEKMDMQLTILEEEIKKINNLSS